MSETEVKEEDKTGDENNEDKSKDEQLEALLAEKKELEDKNTQLEKDAEKTAEEARVLDEIFLQQGFLKDIPGKEDETKPVPKEEKKEDALPLPVDADGKFDHNKFRKDIMVEAQKIIDAEKEKVTDELKAMQVSQTVAKFQTDHTDFEELRPEMMKLAKANPTISLEAAYEQAALDRDSAKLAVDREDFEKQKKLPPTERRAAGGDRDVKPKTWQEVLDEKYAEHYDVLHAYDDFDQP